MRETLPPDAAASGEGPNVEFLSVGGACGYLAGASVPLNYTTLGQSRRRRSYLSEPAAPSGGLTSPVYAAPPAYAPQPAAWHGEF
ncbi:hypothetical protein RAS1_21510 [Phycisphaerae bacterium RAS1]|nr:hypothetical protein RAS1_21510 [Phycisphaerae bacterium RAS1]